MRCDPKEERAEKIIISAVEKLDEVEGKDGKVFREVARTVFKVLRLERESMIVMDMHAPIARKHLPLPSGYAAFSDPWPLTAILVKT